MLGETLPEVLMYRSMLRICILYLIMTFVILAPSIMMIVLLLFLQKQNLAFAVYQFGSVLSLPD